MNPQVILEEVVNLCQNLRAPTVLEVDPVILHSADLTQMLSRRGIFVARVDEVPIHDKQNLLDVLRRKFGFPDYFGNNWDALRDCLLDFSWLPAQGYVLIFPDPMMLNKADLETFLDIVQEVSATWARENIPFKLLVSQEGEPFVHRS